MSADNYTDLARHEGHDVSVVVYNYGENVAVECNDCSEVLFDFDHPAE